MIVGKFEKLVENRGELRGTGLWNYSRYTIRSTRFGSVELKKGFPSFACRELNRGHSDGGCRVERRLGTLGHQDWNRKQRLMQKVSF